MATDFSQRSEAKSKLASSEQALIREFMQALGDEIDAIKKGRGGSIIPVFDGRFVRREGQFYVYVFSTESPLIVMDDAPAEVEIGGQRFNGQIVSVQGSEVAVAIEHDCGKTIQEARLITNLCYLLEALRKRYEEVLAGQRTLDTRLALELFGSVSLSTIETGPEAARSSGSPELKCDKCGSPMVRRKGRFGEFLGCSTYPKCKNIRKIRQ